MKIKQLPVKAVTELEPARYPVGAKRLLDSLQLLCEEHGSLIERVQEHKWIAPEGLEKLMHVESKAFKPDPTKEITHVTPLSFVNLALEAAMGYTLFGLYSREWCDGAEEVNDSDTPVLINSEGRAYKEPKFRGYILGTMMAGACEPDDTEDYFLSPV